MKYTQPVRGSPPAAGTTTSYGTNWQELSGIKNGSSFCFADRLQASPQDLGDLRRGEHLPAVEGLLAVACFLRHHFQVLFTDIVLRDAAVILKGFDGGHDDYCVRP